MSKFVVVVFDDEKSAYEGSQAVLDLHREGSIVAYAGAVITKDNNGRVLVKDGADEGPVGTALGMFLGGLVGALAGPEGMLVGAASGSMGGWVADLYNVGVDGEFLDDVSTALAPGKFAVVAEVSEGWTAPLDTKMEELGGTVLRRWRIDVEDDQIERDIIATERELDELEEEWNEATDEVKDKLHAKVDAAKAKLQGLKEKAAKKVESIDAEVQAKFEKLDAQIAAAKGELKAKFEKRKAEIKDEYETRKEKLKKAGSMAVEALS